MSLLKLVRNRLDFIFYVLEDEGSVYTIFEVLNSRGLDVDWLDKCKSMLMGIAFEKFEPKVSSEHIRELHRYWTNIYQTIGLRTVPGHEILRFAATLKQTDSQSRIISAEKAMEFFRSYCEKNPTAVIEVSQQFLRIAKKLEKLYQNPRLEAVTDIVHARLLAVAIMLKESLTDQERQEILEQWEKVTFRIFGLFRSDARVKVGEYTRLAHKINRSSHITKSQLVMDIKSIGRDYPIGDAIKHLHGDDCYNGWEDDLRYFFYRYEEYLAAKQGGTISTVAWEQIWLASVNTTIEHIYPQKPSSGQRHLSERHLNCLGNLMLLPPNVNSEASAKPFGKKKEIYQKHRQLKLVDEILEQSDWTTKTIEERENRLLNWAKETWG